MAFQPLYGTHAGPPEKVNRILSSRHNGRRHSCISIFKGFLNASYGLDMPHRMYDHLLLLSAPYVI